jgi:NAD-dependent deacetylase
MHPLSDMPLRGPGGRLDAARALLVEAASAVAFTGAGVSAESGVPTFRGTDGLWRRHRPEELATPEAFDRDPCLVWEWYESRRERIRSCYPNAAHIALAEWLFADPESRTLITQNVDGLQEQALSEVGGIPIAELPAIVRPRTLHGSIFRARCLECRRERPWREPVDASSRESLPRCPDCRGLLRPAVVWFGEALDPAVLDDAMTRAQEADVGLIVGTSGLVQPAASLPHMTRESGGSLIEVNPEPTPTSGLAQVWFASQAARMLPDLLLGI